MAFQNRSVNVHQFAMIPRADIPRSSFAIEKMHKTTFDSGYLIPIWVDEVLPGDTFNLRMTLFGRLATPLFPVMDNLYLDSFFFFVPNRLLWDNWQKFMGEQRNPADSISFVIPTLTSANDGFPILTIFDYMGLPTVGQVTAANDVVVNALPLRAYNLIWNEWFRDENLQNSVVINVDDGPDAVADYTLLRRGKRKDYFTGALPFPQKGASVSLPLGSSAPVIGNGLALGLRNASTTAGLGTNATGLLVARQSAYGQNWGVSDVLVAGPNLAADTIAGVTNVAANSGLIADLSAATAATVNQLRQSFQIQKLLERDARGGTRYTEIIRAHFGVVSPDARLQRPEYLGGGSQRLSISPVPQTSATSVEGSDTPQGNLAAMGTVLANGHGFSQSFTEHGYIIGLVSVRADLNYQQGLRRMWSRSTRYDFYFPAFATLGEQTILNKEIYCTGTATDENVFGYQERWAEYRYNPSLITGLFRSTSANTIDPWHLAQDFATLPTLNEAFIQENPPLQRVLAVGAEAAGQELIVDAFFRVKAARPMPMYSVPGLIDHF